MRSKYHLFIITILCGLLLISCKDEKKSGPEMVVEPAPESHVKGTYHEIYLKEISYIKARVDSASTEGMVQIPGGTYMMGGNSDQAKENEFPRHQETVKELWVDETEVTNAQFRRFIEETGYVTTAERTFEINGKKYPPGALVFDPFNPQWWWKFVKDANWKQPEGPGSNIEGKDDYPVVQVSWYDAKAYAKWAGKRLPTEVEFEYFNRAGNDSLIYNWGNDYSLAAEHANYFQGNFPFDNWNEDSFPGLAPVKSFAPNQFGLYDTTGNVWEWCLDTYYPDAYSRQIGKEDGYFKDFISGKQEKVIRGGSFLCSEMYCTGYRTSARMSSTPDTGLQHTGFRCVKDVER
ncbi:MAG: formylglycine-generating enzyme family protein [Christiangramia sp.]|uniref:formylglycine-generating enzyme family protein n=1 Tax=Christiangramia sp. TaxID=1931228 RepID=UPI003242CBF7